MGELEDDDPLVNEIHAIRRKIWEAHGNDIGRVVQHYMEYQKQFSDRLISSPSRTPPT